ncbi:acyl-CoA dehydrogenase family protein [Actinocrispum wychmicini]|uniref:Alkylation response protein AidB-like acyl-CoA dehydrogenase n=1 Tax=Actinocrispum wychmicini TaxID=1213861 RepID=A0A4R2JNR0_9PSEU|nr:acyl-CoA dehydrogenase family protein [Actinocrispum wychmicini]TCO60617.1 alkylation response protein AidB-like acyl-CoA dehydrogenase [Actinocrispum wychmicini]
MAGVTELAALVGSLERHLGDPFDDLPLSFASARAHDERETYPHLPLAYLHAWSAQDYAVPVSAGGRAVDVQDSLALVTQVARRDAAVAMAMCTTSLSYMPIWVAGTDDQRRHYGQRVMAGAKMCWGLTESAHGSDVLANAMSARKADGGYLVSGEKWLIGNGTLADHLVLFVRTAERGGPGGFSILVVDRHTVPAHQIRPLPKQRLHGVRGVDTSGFRLTDVYVPSSALVGAEGRGLEITLKSSHSIRVMVTALAQGCADTALRLTTDFAVTRTVFGQRVIDLPVSRRALVGCFADLLIADVVGTCAARSLQVVPEQSSVFSAVAKHFVPSTLERTVTELAAVLGARYYLRDHPRYGVFQKLKRDLPITGFADGNSLVNLKNIALQLDTLLGARDTPPTDRARVVFDWDADLPEYRPWAAEPFHRGGDDVLLSLGTSLESLRERAVTAGGPEADRLVRCVRLGELFIGQLARVMAELSSLPRRSAREYGQSAELFDLAGQYTVLHAAAACLGHAVHSAGWLEGTPLAGALPTLLCLERLWHRFEPHRRFTTSSDVEAGADVLHTLHATGKSFGYRQFSLAKEVGT